MSRKTYINLALLTAAGVGLAAQNAHAVPVSGLYLEDPRCDVVPTHALTHELGEVTAFPINEAFSSLFQPTNTVICVPDDLIQNDWRVEIRNLSGIAWKDLFFVADLGMTVGNSDGSMIDTVNAPGVTSDAFRIDGTVTPGVNSNLYFESITANEIFEPGESWRFLVTNFFDPAGTSPPPTFVTPGLFAGSSPWFVGAPGSASILATPVIPEPNALAALAIIGGALLMRRRPRHT